MSHLGSILSKPMHFMCITDGGLEVEPTAAVGRKSSRSAKAKLQLLGGFCDFSENTSL